MSEIEELAEIFKALSDPTRLKLIKLLGDRKGMLCVKALARKLKVSQPAVSQHMRILKQAGLVKGIRHGCFVHYKFNKKTLKKYLLKFEEKWSDSP